VICPGKKLSQGKQECNGDFSEQYEEARYQEREENGNAIRQIGRSNVTDEDLSP